MREGRLCDRVVVMAPARAVAEGTVAGCGAPATNDFEQAFVQLAFGDDALAAETGRGMMSAAWMVFEGTAGCAATAARR